MKQIYISDSVYSKLEELLPLYIEWEKKQFDIDVDKTRKYLIDDVLYHSICGLISDFKQLLSAN